MMVHVFGVRGGTLVSARVAVLLFQIARGGTFVPECVLVHSCSRISGGRILFSVMAFRFRLCGDTIVSVCVAVLSFQSECGGALASGPAR